MMTMKITMMNSHTTPLPPCRQDTKKEYKKARKEGKEYNFLLLYIA